MQLTAANLTLAVPAAMLAAASFGLTAALQHRGTHNVRGGGALRLGLLVDLASEPIWVASLLANLVGIVGQWIALSAGPLVLVQPLLVTGVLFAVVFAAALRHNRPDRTVLYGGALAMFGLSAFLLLARPSGGGGQMELSSVLPLSFGLAVILLVCLTIAVHTEGKPRTMAYAVATGVLYGATAGLIKLAVDALDNGVAAMLTDWPIYAVAVLGPLGFLLNQNAFQSSEAVAPELTVIIVLDPLVSIGVGVLWLGESLQAGSGTVLGQVVALGLMIGGIAVVTRAAPQAAGRGAAA